VRRYVYGRWCPLADVVVFDVVVVICFDPYFGDL